MNFDFLPMTQEQAVAISNWKYDGVYAFYDWTADPDDLAGLLDPKTRAKGHAHAVLDDEDSLIGFYGFGSDGSAVEIGFGLRPDLTRRGLGLSFVEAGLQFARENYTPSTFRLQVAAFNERAIIVYERAGFERQRNYRHKTNGGEFDFVEMTRPA